MYFGVEISSNDEILKKKKVNLINIEKKLNNMNDQWLQKYDRSEPNRTKI